MQNNGKVCLITGASSGLGFAMAENLAKQGYTLILVARNQERLQTAAAKLQTQGHAVFTFKADISSEGDLTLLTQYVRQNFKHIDFLILNAGILHLGALASANTSQLKQVLEVNLWGSILCAKFLGDLLINKAKVLIICSTLGLLGMAGYPAYGAAKAGLLYFAAGWRRELLYKQIKVYVACPEDIDTAQYQYEKSIMPDWMNMENRSKPVPPNISAKRILKKCKGNRFLIITDKNIWILLILRRLLPLRIFNFVIDRILPRPQQST